MCIFLTYSKHTEYSRNLQSPIQSLYYLFGEDQKFWITCSLQTYYVKVLYFKRKTDFGKAEINGTLNWMKMYNREQNNRVILIKFVKIWRHEFVLDTLNTVQEFIRPSLRLVVSRGHDALGHLREKWSFGVKYNFINKSYPVTSSPLSEVFLHSTKSNFIQAEKIFILSVVLNKSVFITELLICQWA